MKTSMDDYVAGTAKAMANWRFGVDKLDDFNKSNYAAMQVGVVSFEELAKVQSTFAGSAASINQSFDTANKLFSIFTVKTKSVDEAATLTKSLFNDLTKSQTVKAFKSIGIDLFDSNRQLKQADQIMLELNDKFRMMKNDRAVVNLKNQFKGSEGLIAMIQAATEKTGELRNMLNEFQDSKFNADMALSQAHNDILARQEELSNRVDNLMIRLGNKTLAWKAKILDAAEWVVDRVNWNTKSSDEKKEAIYNAQERDVYEQHGHIIGNVANMSEDDYKRDLNFLQNKQKEYRDNFDKTTEAYAKANKFSSILFGTNLESYDKENNYSRYQNLGRSKAYQSLIHDLQDAMDEKNKIKPDKPTANKNSGSNGSLSGGSSGLSDSLSRVVGAASAPRNITINIDAFNKGGINTQNTSLQSMDANQIEDWFTDMCMRAVNNVELSYN
jgi:TP901 family phage tail tape measure protein